MVPGARARPVAEAPTWPRARTLSLHGAGFLPAFEIAVECLEDSRAAAVGGLVVPEAGQVRRLERGDDLDQLGGAQLVEGGPGVVAILRLILVPLDGLDG